MNAANHIINFGLDPDLTHQPINWTMPTWAHANDWDDRDSCYIMDVPDWDEIEAELNFGDR